MSIHGAINPTTSPRAAGPGAVVAPADGGPRDARPGKAPALSVRDLSKSYKAGVAGCHAHIGAVRRATFDVEPGEMFGIVGPVGAGKSTLLLCMAGLLRPDAGTVAWFGQHADPAGRPPGVVYVPERATHYGFMTVREAIEHHALLRDGTIGACDHDSIAAAMAGSALERFATTRIADLPWSVGPQLSIAQALAARPRVLLLDETLSGLAAPARRDIVATLRRLAVGGAAVVIAARTLDALDGVPSRVALMVGGCVSPPVEPSTLVPSVALELTIAVPATGNAVVSSRVAEGSWERRVVRVPLEGTTPEAILSRCRSCGIRVEGSRVVPEEPGSYHAPLE